MLSIGRKKKKQIHSFPRKLVALNSENRKGLWKLLLRALSSDFWVYTCVKWEVDFFVCVCETPNLYFTCRQKWNIYHCSTFSYSTEMFVYKSILYILQMVRCSGLRIFLLILASSHTQEPAIPPNHSCWNSGWEFSSWQLAAFETTGSFETIIETCLRDWNENKFSFL